MWQSPQLSSARAKLTISWSTSAGMGHPKHPGLGVVTGVITSGLVTQCVMHFLLSTDDPMQSFLIRHMAILIFWGGIGWIQSLVLIWDPSPMPGLPQVALQEDQVDQDDHLDLVTSGLVTQGIIQLPLSVCMSVFPFRTPKLFILCHLQPRTTLSVPPTGGLGQIGNGNLLVLFFPFLGWMQDLVLLLDPSPQVTTNPINPIPLGLQVDQADQADHLGGSLGPSSNSSSSSSSSCKWRECWKIQTTYHWRCECSLVG